jgi:hypothetical protein
MSDCSLRTSYLGVTRAVLCSALLSGELILTQQIDSPQQKHGRGRRERGRCDCSAEKWRIP